jgi:hypothetical protein
MGCNCGGTAKPANMASVKWVVNGTEYPTLADARQAAREQGAQVQRVFG